MIKLKTSDEIAVMKESGGILKDVLELVISRVKKGIRLSDLDKYAEQEILKRNAEPSFKRVKNYRWTLCTSVNDVIVHGIPDDYMLKDGDVVGIDCGVYYKNFNTDAAWTVRVGNYNKSSTMDETDKFLFTGQKALKKAISMVVKDNYIYDISRALQETIESEKYSVVPSLVGHGVGKELHEDPEIPGFVKGKRTNTPKIVEGMTLAIEVIYNKGSEEVVYNRNDGWTISTKDGKISGLFEATVAMTSHGCIVLT
ncbi:type I methionyl aminopeptidase [Candidatus Gottesmanbacteria bacterium CG11_big_fil_rev_8_21_14_0_20_37_11]|uniref:Methionine aminopeptidase n=3 Tax=Candidatus Gottesmaniibacteriota TaxID=1752720 RepID=A0A2M7RRY0_9BACT|nr:MAG: type I methionyl aminopeptidase [Candidatus Gottesmanbacteria bacterium CG1_02_37_22]PIP32631.1 MAG: type I methionyl aminopeptidase [Candidatus Gottesmanbacteria bacterium CG23_combo_of_CG06-09_8_20_14_all_37_19]PIR08507.1 MAG: type I methionyl aminopeptidase [Candidatus Gottesmanbacteria bacterium CG11_big_fil_rev_8_21_14_0_20_37_11]PIZ03063.1 MAG: type I methionyl aminopeptidase [Candidatus Gottesmanbacteria bacterium CG_4_10_14_0_8_um_filter_37_24]